MSLDTITPASTQAAVTAKRATKDKGRGEIAKLANNLKRLVVEYLPLGAIKPNCYNPNRQSEHDFELLLASIQEDGMTQPIVCVRINESHRNDPKFPKMKQYAVGDIMIVDGEHRWRGCSTLGFKEVPVCVTDMTLAQAMIATLRHNRARGSEDVELAADVLRDLQSLGALEWAKDSLMLDDAEVNKLLNDVQAPEGLAGEEFSEAWQPVLAGDHKDTQAVEIRSLKAGGTVATAMTPEAVQAARDQEQRLQAATTAEDKAKIRQEQLFHRVHLTFTGVEGDLVKRVLGKEPAKRLIELCRAADTTT